MKNAILLYCFMLSMAGFSQAYEIDPEFGSDSVSRLGDKTLLDQQQRNGNFYLLFGSGLNSDLRIIDANGATQSETSANTSHIAIVGNDIYGHGSSAYNNNSKIVIKKFGLDGALQTGFGVDGVKTIVFGLNEELVFDIKQTADGNLLCAATRRNESSNTVTLITFKIDPLNGSLITGYSASGYKEHLTLSCSGNYPLKHSVMLPYGDNFLLVGAYNNMVYTMCIDGNGETVTTYGSGGYRNFTTTYPINDFYATDTADNKLYLQYTSAAGTNVWYRRLLIADLGTGATVWQDYNNYDVYSGYGDVVLSNNAVYSAEIADVSVPLTTREMKIRKQHLDGTRNSSFHAGGLFRYTYHGVADFDTDRNEVEKIFANTDGTLTIIGKVKVVDVVGTTFPFFNTYYQGHIMFRVRESDEPLQTNTFDAADTTLAPNPFNDVLTLSSRNSVARLELFDLTGRKLGEPAYNRDNGMVDLSAVTHRGTYLLKIYAGGKTTTKKIVKK